MLIASCSYWRLQQNLKNPLSSLASNKAAWNQQAQPDCSKVKSQSHGLQLVKSWTVLETTQRVSSKRESTRA